MIDRIDLKVGFRCNNYCHFCAQGDRRERLPAKPEDELVRSLEEGRAAGAVAVVITGGEPTLHKGIVEIARKARALGYAHVQVQSNGRAFCYEEFCKRLIDAGVDEFGPSLHGSTAKIHDALTQAPGAFMQTVAGMRQLRRLGQRIIVNCVITRRNYRDLPSLARLLVALDVDQFQLAFMHMCGRAGENKAWLTARKKLAEPYVKRALDVGIRAGKRVMTEAIPYCLMSGYEAYVAERIIPRTRVYDAERVIEDYTRARVDEGKSRGPRCVECDWSSVCEGPWREYPLLFGWDEFVPVKGRCVANETRL